LSNVSRRAINLNGVNWANGRVPYLVTGNATKNGQTTTIHFIVIHAKANTGDDQAKVDSYLERRAGIKELKDTLDTYFANSNIILLGDFNDDLDRTIAPTTGPDTVSSYQLLISDSTDGNSYRSLTLPLSNLGLASTTTFPDVIDHVVVSNEMALRYLNLSSSIYNDIETIASITNFDGTTSDHYPVMTRFQFGGTLPITLASFNATKESNTVKLNWATSQELNTKEFAIEHSADGRKFEVITNVPARGNGSVTTTYQAIHQRPLAGNNFYRLKSIDSDGKASFSGVVKINFSKNFTISLTPNPASQYVTINLSNNREALQMQIVDMNGKVMKSSVLASHVNRISLAGLGKGLYLVKVQGVGEAYTEKLLVQ
ncbi:MAG TPA: T9SS type A sorting domain-containing protein, partial [Flavisolibacter sp.]|nr:T9SS type A sorting domain-containing protein [Flavisolibacter sp.]